MLLILIQFYFLLNFFSIYSSAAPSGNIETSSYISSSSSSTSASNRQLGLSSSSTVTAIELDHIITEKKGVVPAKSSAIALPTAQELESMVLISEVTRDQAIRKLTEEEHNLFILSKLNSLAKSDKSNKWRLIAEDIKKFSEIYEPAWLVNMLLLSSRKGCKEIEDLFFCKIIRQCIDLCNYSRSFYPQYLFKSLPETTVLRMLRMVALSVICNSERWGDMLTVKIYSVALIDLTQDQLHFLLHLECLFKKPNYFIEPEEITELSLFSASVANIISEKIEKHNKFYQKYYENSSCIIL